MISSVCLYFVLKGVSWAIVMESILQVNIPLLILVIAVYFIAYGLRAVRWHFLLKNIADISPQKLFPHLMIGFFINNILPLRIGEFARAYSSGKKLGIAKTASFGSIVLERTFDLICFVLLISASIVFIPFPRWVKHGALFAGFLCIIVAGFLIFFTFFEQKAKALIPFLPIPLRLKSKAESLILSFITGFKSLKSIKTVLIVTFMTMSIWFIELSCFYLMTIAFQIKITFTQAVFSAVCIVLGVIVPAAPGYVGTYEFAGKTALTTIGVDPNIAVSFTLFLHFIQFFVVAVAGIPSLIVQNLSIREIRSKKL